MWLLFFSSNETIHTIKSIQIIGDKQYTILTIPFIIIILINTDKELNIHYPAIKPVMMYNNIYWQTLK